MGQAVITKGELNLFVPIDRGIICNIQIIMVYENVAATFDVVGGDADVRVSGVFGCWWSLGLRRVLIFRNFHR